MKIFLTDDLWFKTKPFRFYAGSQDLEITTPWPHLIDKLISIKVTSKEDSSSKPFEELIVSLTDSEGNTNDSAVDGRGIARFSLIPPDKYTINIQKTTSNENSLLVASKQIILDGSQELFSIPIDPNDSSSLDVNFENKKGVKSLVKKWYKDELNDFEFVSGFFSFAKNEVYDSQLISSVYPLSWKAIRKVNENMEKCGRSRHNYFLSRHNFPPSGTINCWTRIFVYVCQS